MIYKVIISDKAQKQLRKVPRRILVKLGHWAKLVRKEGLEEVRKLKGFHDEPLSGARKNQRSIRLNIHYRAFYEIKKNDSVEFVSVEEVNKHEY